MSSHDLYNNDAYRELITEFFGEFFYLPGLSYGTKVQKIRQYTEIILRRLLHYRCDKNLELGNDRTLEKLTKQGYTEPLFRDSLEIIRTTGNERSHTRYRKVATEAEYNKALDCLFNIYGYLFYKYFQQAKFGTNPEIVSAFSCLPPIIRYIALSALYADDPSNTWVIEKLVLAMIKAFSAEKAETWVEDHNTQLRGYSFPIDSETMMQLINTFGSDQGPIVASLLSTTMYDRCKSIIQTMGIGSGYKPLYTDFETAKEYYEQHGVVKGTTKEVADFNDLMEFVYIGRRTKEKEIENVSEENYIIRVY